MVETPPRVKSPRYGDHPHLAIKLGLARAKFDVITLFLSPVEWGQGRGNFGMGLGCGTNQNRGSG